MRHGFTSSFTPPQTPKALRKLLIILACISLSSAFLNQIFYSIWQQETTQLWLSLSSFGITKYFFWQPFTYVFVGNTFGLNMGFLISLAFQLYMLWVIGSMVIERVGTKSFFRFCFSCCVTTGILLSICALTTTTNFRLAGLFPLINGLFFVWAMMHRHAIILLFFILPVKARWLAIGYLGFSLLQSFAHEAYLQMFAEILGPLIAYLWGVLFWNLKAPFESWEVCDRALLSLKQKVLALYQSLFGSSYEKSAKTVDFRTGKAVFREEEFMDAMLDKINREGKDSLSFWEKWKMKRISKRQKGQSS